MAERIWERFLTDQDRAHLAAKGALALFGFGSRPAVLSIDNYRQVIGDEPEPLLEAIETWPGAVGLAGWEALPHISRLLEVARSVEIPVLHVTGLLEEESNVMGWWERPGASQEPDDDASKLRRFDIVEQAAPLAGEVVVRKTAPSAFFGTPLLGHLISTGVDTLIVCGESTSGCVRASVVDACAYRFNVVVVEEAVYDRHEASHAINLFDMHQKYADVLGIDEVISWIQDRPRVPYLSTRG